MIRTLSLLLSLMLLPSLAQAAPKLNIDLDESRKTFTTSVNFGGMFYDDAIIESIYGSKGQFFPNVTFGIVPWHQIILVEIDISISFSQFFGAEQFVSGAGASVDKVMMTVFPITVDLLIGIDIVDEQPVVPFGGFGMNYTLFRENQTNGGSEWSGDKVGYSAFFGGAFLLDVLEVRRSRTLDATTGINDAYITVEGRYRDVKTQFLSTGVSTEGLSFGGWSVMAGLKLVY